MSSSSSHSRTELPSLKKLDHGPVYTLSLQQDTMWYMVWQENPQLHCGVDTSPHLNTGSWQTPCRVRILFKVFHCWRGKLKLATLKVGLSICLPVSGRSNAHLTFHWALMLKLCRCCASATKGFLDLSLPIDRWGRSACTGKSGLLVIFLYSFTKASCLRRARGAMLVW